MNEICLFSQWGHTCFHIPHKLQKKLLFSVALFREWFYDNQFSKTKFNLLKILETSQELTRAMLVKLQTFISQFKQFQPGRYYHIAYLGGYFWIYV